MREFVFVRKRPGNETYCLDPISAGTNTCSSQLNGLEPNGVPPNQLVLVRTTDLVLLDCVTGNTRIKLMQQNSLKLQINNSAGNLGKQLLWCHSLPRLTIMQTDS